jgi:uncharacterized OsmC-like protein
MNAHDLRAIQAPLKERYQQDPQTAHATLNVRAEIDLPTLSCRIDHTGPSRERAGMHPMAGGDGQTACATEMLLEALAGCAGVTFAAVATAMDLPVEFAGMTVSGTMDFRGTLAISRTVPVGFQTIRIVFELQSSAPDEKLAKAVELAERYCVVAQSLKTVSTTWKRRTQA